VCKTQYTPLERIMGGCSAYRDNWYCPVCDNEKMNKSVKLIMSRFGSKCEFMHGSVKSAARDACADVEANEAAPVRIEKDGKIAWENNGPFGDSYDKLRELAGLPPEYT